MSARRTQDRAPKRAGAGRLALRFAVGMHLDGRARTDATFLTGGTQPVELGWFSRGQASKWAMLPGWQRAVIRWALLALLIGLWRDRHATEWALALIGGPVVGLAAWRVLVLVRTRQHRREVVTPLAEALAPSLEMSPFEATRALSVPRHHDRQDAQVTAALPDGHQGQPSQTEAFTRIVGQRLGGEWEARISRKPLALIASRRPDPPGRVEFAQVADLIRASTVTRPLMGLAAGDDPLWLDFGSQIAGLGLSVGTGGGKSAFLRYLIAQFAFHGVADFRLIDSKLVSLAGMESLPGLRIYREAPDQWAALAELRADMNDRYRRLLADPSATFPLCIILLEEQNDASMEWRHLWRELPAGAEIPGGGVKPGRAPATPPVYSDITRLMIKGRQVGYRTIGAYQRLTAAACGGMDATVMRDAYGQKALSRFSPGAWMSLTGIRPIPPSSLIEGRWTTVIGGHVRQVQVPYAEAAELLEFVGSSPLAGHAPVSAPLTQVTAPGQDTPAPAEAAPSPAVRQLHAAPRYLTQAEVADRLGMNLAALIKWRQRCSKAGDPLPEPTYFAGRPGWTDDQLAEMAARRGAGARITAAGSE